MSKIKQEDSERFRLSQNNNYKDFFHNRILSQYSRILLDEAITKHQTKKNKCVFLVEFNYYRYKHSLFDNCKQRIVKNKLYL